MVKPIRGHLLFDHDQGHWQAGAMGIAIVGTGELPEEAIFSFWSGCEREIKAKSGKKKIDFSMARQGRFFSIAGKDLQYILEAQ